MSDGPPRWKMIAVRFGLRLLGSTWRYREVVPPECSAIVAGDEPAVIAFWHGGMFPVWHRFRRQRPAAMVSASNDGTLLADYLTRGLGYARVIRGSSSRGGSEALHEMTDALAGRSCLITPDGPRGPARQAKPGALVASMRSRRRLLLAGWNCRHAVRLRSWDSMSIPFPFSSIDIRYCIFEIPQHADQDAHIDDETLQAMNVALDSLSRLEDEG